MPAVLSNSSSRIRPLRIFVLAFLMVTALLATAIAPGQATADDDDDRRGINGTVISVGDTSMRVAVRSGLKTVFVDADTRIRNGREDFPFSSISRGDRISASVEPLSDGQLLAKKIRVRGKSSSKQVQHLTGVVIERDEDSIRLASRNGRSVEIEFDDDDDRPEIADVVTAIVENDLATGRLKARQIDRVDRIVQKLEKALEKQVDKAKASVLRKIIDESARQHLDTLNQTLDQVEDEAKEKIQAALMKFRRDYADLAERVGNAPPEESYRGVISELTSDSIRVSSNTGDGFRLFSIDGSTGIVVGENSSASLTDLELGRTVTVSFAPLADGESGDPLALTITAEPPALPPVVADAIEDMTDNVVEGEVIVVEDDATSDSVVVIVDEDDSGDTVGVEVTSDTEVIVDGEEGDADDLGPEQRVELTVGEDGVTADTVVVTTEQPGRSGEAKVETHIAGVVTAVDADRNTIMVAPPVGEPLRLTVDSATVITVASKEPSLYGISANDMVLGTSKYIESTFVLTRLAVTPTQSAPAAGENGSGGSGQGAENASGNAAPFSIVGVLKSFDDDVMVFDGMTLPKSSGIELPEGVAAGNSVELLFTTTSDGAVVLTGIQAR